MRFSHLPTLFLLGLALAAPSAAQTLRGTVTDQDTGEALAGATVVLAGSEPLVGATTDAGGRFRLDGVPVGRHDLVVRFLGYEARTVREVLVSTGRETVVPVALRASVLEGEGVIVTAATSGTEPLDPLAVASARLLRAEQTARYAGAFDDPARLVAALAGAAGALGDNAVAVRGNAPRGLLWRMDGIEIPTPNHFANLLSLGGGGITALSTRMLGDSDFFLGAFPAEYGGALSGVFDLRLRTGNDERREQSVRAGIIGLDASAEGPFAAGYDGSYLFNYRYSTFGLLGPLLPEDASAIRFQNLALKLHLPAGRAGTFSLFGLGATDRSGQSPSGSFADWTYRRDLEDVESPTRFGAASVQHRFLLGGRGYVESHVAATGNALSWTVDRLTEDGTLRPAERVGSEQGRLAAGSTANLRLGTGHTNRTGVVLSRLGYRQDIRIADDEALETVVDADGHTFHAQAFSQSRFDVGPLAITAGAHVQHFGLTRETTVEPRAGVRLRLGMDRYASLAYGLHAQREHLALYFAHPDNRDLRMTRAHHVVAAYGQRVAPHTHVTVEAYLQALSNVPVAPGSSFSTLNLELDWFLREPLANRGAGRNVGLELTVERGLAEGWYALATGTLFSSRYRDGADVWRPTRFDRTAVGALLAGREWTMPGRRATRTLGLNGRVSALGGRRHAPIDLARSLDAEDVVYDETRAFALREPVVLYADATVEYRVHRARTTTTWALQLVNATGYEEFYGHRYNRHTRSVEPDREAIVLPNLSVTLEW